MNTENPDQTPTTEADAFETSLGHAVTQYRMAEAVAKIRTLEHQRNIVRAEATEARDKLESRTRGMLARINDLNAQLSESRSTLRATRDADHGAAIEEAAKSCAGHDWIVIADHMRALVATVTNSQQKGGEEPCMTNVTSIEGQVCAETQTARSTVVSNAAPTSDPEGAATFGYHLISDAEFAEHGFGAKAATPSPALEKLAQEIDDIYEAPSRIRLLRRILEREFGARQSVAETAKEIIEVLSFGGNHAEVTRQIESILSRFREHELRELREECERLRKDKERMDWLEANREKIFCLSWSNIDQWSIFAEPEDKWSGGIPMGDGADVRAAIDAAMQPSAQSK